MDHGTIRSTGAKYNAHAQWNFPLCEIALVSDCSDGKCLTNKCCFTNCIGAQKRSNIQLQKLFYKKDKMFLKNTAYVTFWYPNRIFFYKRLNIRHFQSLIIFLGENIFLKLRYHRFAHVLLFQITIICANTVRNERATTFLVNVNLRIL